MAERNAQKQLGGGRKRKVAVKMAENLRKNRGDKKNSTNENDPVPPPVDLIESSPNVIRGNYNQFQMERQGSGTACTGIAYASLIYSFQKPVSTLSLIHI